MATALVTLATAVACSVTPSYSAPKSFTVGNDAVAQVVHDAIAGDTWRTQMDGSPTVDCSGQTSCTISYTVKQPTSGNDLDLIEPTRQMWKAFFADPQFQSGTIHVSDPATTSGGKSHTAHYYTLTCDRNRGISNRLG